MSTTNEVQAGRELDALVAERVFGWRWWSPADDGPFRVLVSPGMHAFAEETPAGTAEEDVWRDPRCWSYTTAAGPHQFVPRYSTGISVAWEVVEKMAERGWTLDLRYDPKPWVEGVGAAIAEFRGLNFDADAPEFCAHHRATADTVALAIVRAALATLNPEPQP
jgi:hypothetical protein